MGFQLRQAAASLTKRLAVKPVEGGLSVPILSEDSAAWRRGRPGSGTVRWKCTRSMGEPVGSTVGAGRAASSVRQSGRTRRVSGQSPEKCQCSFWPEALAL